MNGTKQRAILPFFLTQCNTMLFSWNFAHFQKFITLVTLDLELNIFLWCYLVVARIVGEKNFALVSLLLTWQLFPCPVVLRNVRVRFKSLWWLINNESSVSWRRERAIFCSSKDAVASSSNRIAAVKNACTRRNWGINTKNSPFLTWGFLQSLMRYIWSQNVFWSYLSCRLFLPINRSLALWKWYFKNSLLIKCEIRLGKSKLRIAHLLDNPDDKLRASPLLLLKILHWNTLLV